MKMLKSLKLLITVAVLVAFSGCAVAQPAPSNGIDLSKLPLAKLTHGDLKTAAEYANSNGYPARAAVYTAIEAQLTACEAAIAAAGPKSPPPGGTVGAFTLFEMGAEAVANGIPAAVKINCGAITLP
jgi:hypothetical protein